MRRFWTWTGAATALVVAAMAATLRTPVGFSLWHYNVAFLVTLVAAGASLAALRARRVATLVMAFWGAIATVTGFAMLYTIQFPYKDWLTWWHSVTSVAFLLAFLVHWSNNQPRLWIFTKRLFAPERAPGYAVAGAWLSAAAVGAWTWGPGARAFRDSNYLYLASWAVLVGVALAYGAWLVARLPSLRARLARTAGRNHARALVDTSLFLANWAALLTGFALLYFAAPLRGGDLKYVSKWWHTATSVALLALLALHVGFNARLVAAHARRLSP